MDQTVGKNIHDIKKQVVNLLADHLFF